MPLEVNWHHNVAASLRHANKIIIFVQISSSFGKFGKFRILSLKLQLF